MSEKGTILNDKETQDTQLELDVSCLSSAPAEKPMTKKQAKKAAKAAKKAAKAEKKAGKCKKCNKKKEKKCKKCVFFAWLAFLASVACVVAPFATLVGPAHKPIANNSLFNGFLASTRFACDWLNLDLNFALIDNAPTILTAGRQGFVYNCVLLVLPFVILFNFILTLVASGSKKPCRAAKAVTFINFLYFFGLCFSFCFISLRIHKQISFDLASLVAAAIMFFLFVFCATASKKKAKLAKVKAAVEEATASETTEEVAATEEPANSDEETVTEIEGVCGVIEDEEKETEPVEQSPYTLSFGSSYMKTKQSLMGFAPAQSAATVSEEPTADYDWFLESLTAEERQEFVSLFVYKNLPGTASLPEYVSGGDNYMFFRRFFLNLGKYRNHVSAGLLEKIYQYMTNVY